MRDYALSPSPPGKLLKPAEVGQILGMPAKEVLVLPGLVRVSLSPQRVGYYPADVEDFVNQRRTTQGFLVGIERLFGPPNRRVTVNRVSTVVRIGRLPARWLLDQCERPFPEELAEVLRRFALVQ